ncbi:hypothetical protein, unlikely [Trypanosoma brucei gambiense DAL972]|uniref:Uncharacterized protein n=1 Tax=Trypanosoma brucei gambiense (strain MHOM/CI/86/DAL972) TaxID=679716 RepID=C9ZNX1_TRYB9|nr:hypothetical protein, unlikely [Trypanosoma brucei gambiense DAL972]CBH11099.1 hypothetical protein, unlikely [Trypanosoma brucei gambiense DAL972]|eukprot:XP_011773386.1 hypothetical protein, unlikely [Trypanosoma brucei gambiense DAL972]
MYIGTHMYKCIYIYIFIYLFIFIPFYPPLTVKAGNKGKPAKQAQRNKVTGRKTFLLASPLYLPLPPFLFCKLFPFFFFFQPPPFSRITHAQTQKKNKFFLPRHHRHIHK